MAKTKSKSRRHAADSQTKNAKSKKSTASSSSRRAPRKWSQHVTETSDALDLKADIFKLDDPKKIAASLKRSAERSHRRKSAPYRSAMSMLTFYVNRAGANLSANRRRILDRAKDELRKVFGKTTSAGSRSQGKKTSR
jgi:hypothetical protein